MKCEAIVTTPGQGIGYFADEVPDSAAWPELGIDIAIMGAIDRLRVRLGRDAPIRLVFDNSEELTEVARFVMDRLSPAARDWSRLVHFIREFFGVREATLRMQDSDIGKEPAGNRFQRECPLRVQSSLEAYVRGLPPGDFLRAVLSNDMNEAIARADYENIHALPHIVAYVREHLPVIAWGSAAHVNRWLETKRKERMAAMPYGDNETQMAARYEAVMRRPDSEARGIDDETDAEREP